MSALVQLVRRARRRRLIHSVLQQAAIACAVGLGSAIILLVTGTQLLESSRLPDPWVWPFVIFACSFAWLCRRVDSRRAPDYIIAQQIDHRLGLHDSLSTALFFEQNPQGSPGSPDVIRCQRQRAEDQARLADLSHAIPFIAPRSLYLSGWLAVMAAGLFSARYGITRSLDLRVSLVHLTFHGAPLAVTPAPGEAAARTGLNRNKETRAFQPGSEAQSAGTGATASNALRKAPGPAPQSGQGAPGEFEISSGDSPGGAAGQDGWPGLDSDTAGVNPGPQRLSEGLPGKEADGHGSQSQPGGSRSAGQQEQSSLLERMREAMAGLLSGLGTPKNAGEGKSSARDGSNGSASSRSGAPGARQQSGLQPNSLASGGSPDPNARSARGMKAMRGSDQEHAAGSSDSPTGKSGIGHQDGSKDPHLAEQLAAMGKISEIIGRRSRTITGDVMVEVPSGGEQQLKTAYSGKRASHSDTAGEISRDEIPSMYQDYVQNYFDQIRKLPAPPNETQP